MRRLLPLVLLAFAVGCGGASTGSGADEPIVPPANPEAVRELVEGARVLARARRGAEVDAVRHFEAALAIDPNLWEAHYNIAIVARRAGRFEDAIASLTAAQRIDPASREIALALAECYSSSGDRGRAIDVLRARVERDGEDFAARISLATLLREEGRHDPALEMVRAVLIREPNNVDALLEVARIYRAREQYEVAVLVIEKALTLAGTSDGNRRARLQYERGLLELARGDTQAAFDAFGEANRADPNFRPARRNQAAVLMRAGDYAGAAAELEALLRVDANDQDTHVAHAVALRGQGRHQQARAELEAVLQADPGHLAAIFDLAVLEAEFLNRRTEAKARFENFLSLAPRNHPQRDAASRYVRDLGAELAPRPPEPARPAEPATPSPDDPPVDDGGFEEL